MKTWGPNAKALILHQRMKRLQKTMLDTLQKQGVFIKFEKDLIALLKKEKLDPQTFEALKIYMDREPITITPQVEQLIDRAIEKYSRSAQVSRGNSIPLTLTDDGDLYKEPKEKYCYPLRGEGKRLKILRALTRQTTFIKTRDLVEEVSSTSAEALRDAIGVINRKARTALNLPGGEQNKLILSKAHSGYKINPLYPITPS